MPGIPILEHKETSREQLDRSLSFGWPLLVRRTLSRKGVPARSLDHDRLHRHRHSGTGHPTPVLAELRRPDLASDHPRTARWCLERYRASRLVPPGRRLERGALESRDRSSGRDRSTLGGPGLRRTPFFPGARHGSAHDRSRTRVRGDLLPPVTQGVGVGLTCILFSFDPRHRK